MASAGSKVRTISSLRNPSNFEGTGRSLGKPTGAKPAGTADQSIIEPSSAAGRGKISMKIGKIVKRGNDLGGVGAVGAVLEIDGPLIIGAVDPDLAKTLSQARTITKPRESKHELEVEVEEIEVEGDSVNAFAPVGGRHIIRNTVVIGSGK